MELIPLISNEFHHLILEMPHTLAIEAEYTVAIKGGCFALRLFVSAAKGTPRLCIGAIGAIVITVLKHSAESVHRAAAGTLASGVTLLESFQQNLQKDLGFLPTLHQYGVELPCQDCKRTPMPFHDDFIATSNQNQGPQAVSVANRFIRPIRSKYLV